MLVGRQRDGDRIVMAPRDVMVLYTTARAGVLDRMLAADESGETPVSADG